MTAGKKIQLVRIAHVHYKHKDMDAARAFYQDFGFAEVSRVGKKTYYRGYGTEPFVLCAEEAEKEEFGGPAFVVESEDDLKYASETLPNATDIYELTDAPGGGKAVTFYDPVDNWPFHLVYGQTAVESKEISFPHLDINYVRSPPASWKFEHGWC
jgi:catechol 2,3-dioxygenase-like lactoylglutathione lyase family enzyme